MKFLSTHSCLATCYKLFCCVCIELYLLIKIYIVKILYFVIIKFQMNHRTLSIKLNIIKDKQNNLHFKDYIVDPPHGGPCCFLDRDNNIG
jgi:hypothetical protein